MANTFYDFLNEDVVQKALAIEEPETGKKYAPEKVKRYLKMIDDALKKMKDAENNDKNDAIVMDLRDKKDKWKNLDKETKPIKVKQDEPPPEEEPQEEEPQEKQPPVKNGKPKKKDDEDEETNESKFFRLLEDKCTTCGRKMNDYEYSYIDSTAREAGIVCDKCSRRIRRQ